MAALIGQGAAKDLQDAYEQAVWARPDTRATLLAQQRAEEEQKRRAEAKQKAEDARRKSVSITGGPGNTANSSAPEGRSIRDELSAAIAASSGAV
jgi:nitric oxide reductase activation protein